MTIWPPPQAVAQPPLWHNAPICPSNQPSSMKLASVCPCTHVSHLPFQPGKQHEADLWPLGLWFHHVPVSRVMRLTYVGCCYCCVWVHISDRWQRAWSTGQHTHIHIQTQASEILLALVTFWIHKSASLHCKSMLVNLMNWRVSGFQSFTCMSHSVCVYIHTFTQVSL